MTIETTANRISYTGSGTTGPFSFPYYFLADGDLTVIKTTIADGTEETLTLTTDYTVSGAGEAAGGSVTLVATLSSAYKLTIIRDPDILQPADYPANDRFPAATHEEALDRATMILQRLKDLIDRSFRLSDGDVSGISLILQNLGAGKLIAVNSAGTGIESIAAADVDLATVTPFIQTLLDDADAATARTTLGAASLGANTFTGLQTFAAGADIASATTVDLTAATGNTVDVTHSTGTTAITSLGGASLQAGTEIETRFVISGGTLTLTHHATNLYLAGGANITLANGDVIRWRKMHSSNAEWKMVGGWRADGSSWAVPPSQAEAEAGTATTPRPWTAERVKQAIAAQASGKIVQVVEATPYTTAGSTAAAIPLDSTIPQNTEGAELTTVTITPTNASNRLRIEANLPFVDGSAGISICAALFQDSTANALALGILALNGANYAHNITFTHEMAAGTTSATTFKLRAGPSTGTAYFNRRAAGETLGGVSAVRLRVTEIKV